MNIHVLISLLFRKAVFFVLFIASLLDNEPRFLIPHLLKKTFYIWMNDTNLSLHHFCNIKINVIYLAIFYLFYINTYCFLISCAPCSHKAFIRYTVGTGKFQCICFIRSVTSSVAELH